MFTASSPPRLIRLALIGLTVGAALLLNVASVPLLRFETPFLWYFAAVLLSAWLGGRLGGILATVLSLLAVSLFFRIVGDIQISLTGHVLRLALFGAEGVLISAVIGALQESLRTTRAREDEIHALVDGTTDHALFRVDPLGRVASWNTGAAQIQGYTAQEIIGQPIACFYLPEDVAAGRPEEALRIARETGRYAAEGWRVRQDGTRFWASVVLSRLRDQHGRLVGYAKVTRDMSERHAHEQALREVNDHLEQRVAERTTALAAINAQLAASEARYRTLVQNLPNTTVLMVDHQLRFLVAEGRSLERHGYDRAAMLGRSLQDLIPAGALPFVMPAYAAALAGTATTIEQRVGAYTYQTRFVPVRDSTDTIIAGMAVTEDTTERTQAEQTLRASEARYRLLAEHTSDLIALHSADSRYKYVSPSSVRLLGYTPEELIGRSPYDLAHPEDAARVLQEVAIHQERGGGQITFSNRMQRHDGTWIWFETTAQPIADDAGQISELVSVSRDITVRVAADHMLRESLHEKEILLKEIHHRVKNNLQVVVSLLRLQGRSVTDTVAAAALRDSRQRVEVMALVHELLYSVGNLTMIDAATYVRRLGHHLLRLATHGDDQLSLQVAADDIWLSLDQAVPCGLIINEVVMNSLKYAFPEGQPGTIGIELRGDQPDYIRLHIWDTGVGLPAGSDPGPHRPLGMQLVRDLTRQLHGQITIDGRSGTVVTVTFPPATDRAGR